MEELPLMDAERIDIRINTGLEKDEILLSYKNLQANVDVSSGQWIRCQTVTGRISYRII